MDIPVKFKIGDIVYYLSHNKVAKKKIIAIRIVYLESVLTEEDNKVVIKVFYSFYNLPEMMEYQVFATKEELLKSL